VPERARQVVITAEGGVKIELEPDEGPKSIPGDFFAIPVNPHLGHARINWIDADGSPGSRGIAVSPDSRRVSAPRRNAGAALEGWPRR
jgi:hypothetical protein